MHVKMLKCDGHVITHNTHFINFFTILFALFVVICFIHVLRLKCDYLI